MGLAKTQQFTQAENDVALIGKAFAHPARVAIINFLLRCNCCVTTQLLEEINLSQSGVVQHLRVLKDIGIVQGSIEGTNIKYCINPAKWQEVQNVFNTYANTNLDTPNTTCNTL